jgi:hypothetical protein
VGVSIITSGFKTVIKIYHHEKSVINTEYSW